MNSFNTTTALLLTSMLALAACDDGAKKQPPADDAGVDATLDGANALADASGDAADPSGCGAGVLWDEDSCNVYFGPGFCILDEHVAEAEALVAGFGCVEQSQCDDGESYCGFTPMNEICSEAATDEYNNAICEIWNSGFATRVWLVPLD